MRRYPELRVLWRHRCHPVRLYQFRRAHMHQLHRDGTIGPMTRRRAARGALKIKCEEYRIILAEITRRARGQ